jgi:hypothetical protein
VNGGAQSGAKSFSDHFEFDQNVEKATVDARYSGRTDALFDGSVGVLLWKYLGAGVAITHYAHDGTVDVDASIPHPFFFNRPRAISGTEEGVARSETAVHIQAIYRVDFSARLRMMLSGGPSVFNIDQDLVSDVQYDETFPYDTATFRSATTRPSKGSGAGFNAGVDIAWMFQRHVGVGGFVRGARGRVTLDTPDKRTITVDAGGVQGGAGVRLVF